MYVTLLQGSPPCDVALGEVGAVVTNNGPGTVTYSDTRAMTPSRKAPWRRVRRSTLYGTQCVQAFLRGARGPRDRCRACAVVWLRRFRRGDTLVPRGQLFQPRRGTAAQWATTNPVLAAGEPALETDTGREKVGDGTTVYTGLKYRPLPNRRADNGQLTVKAAGDAVPGVVDWVHDGSVGYLFHLHTGVNSVAGTYTIGIGTDLGAGGAILVSAKNSGEGVHLTSNGSHTGMLLRLIGQGRGDYTFKVESYRGSLGSMFVARNGMAFGDGATTNGSNVFTSATANFTAADIGATITQTTSRGEAFTLGGVGNTSVIAGVTNSTTVTLADNSTGDNSGMNFVIIGGTGRDKPTAENLITFRYEAVGYGYFNLNEFSWVKPIKLSSLSNLHQAWHFGSQSRYYQDNGAGSFVSYRLEPDAFGLKIKSYNANATPGNEGTSQTVIEVGTGGTLGFFAKSPLAQKTRVGQLTDSTGGTVSTTLAAGITDAVAKNAIASLAAKVNALEIVLSAAGGGYGLTA
jgi:hypothetical protein